MVNSKMNSIKSHAGEKLREFEKAIRETLEEIQSKDFDVKEWGVYGYRHLNENWEKYKEIQDKLEYILDLECEYNFKPYSTLLQWLTSEKIITEEQLLIIETLIEERRRLEEKVTIFNRYHCRDLAGCRNLKSRGWMSEEDRVAGYDALITERLNEVTIPDLANIILKYL